MPVNFEPQKTRSRSGFDKNSVKKVGTTGLSPSVMIQEKGGLKGNANPTSWDFVVSGLRLCRASSADCGLKQQILRFREGFAFHFGRDDWIRTSDP